MSSYSESIRYLYGLQKRGMKFGLRGIRALLDATRNPHYVFPSLHIAGTNGKGSTAAMLAAMLTAAGYKTGLYTSPHVVDFTERIRIDGKPVNKQDIVAILRTLKPLVRRYNTTFFETVTALAFHYFAQNKVDIAVIETGLGGRLDATNVVQPLVSVITNIGLEHSEILGASISKIAYEKAGIIKPGVPCITGVREPTPASILRKIARQRSSTLINNRSKTYVRSEDLHGTRFDIRFDGQSLKALQLSLPGRLQVGNAALALQTLRQLDKLSTFRVPTQAVREGLANVQRYSGLRSRLSVVQKKPLIITDVAHNPDAVEALVSSLQGLGIENIILLLGVSMDKDYLHMTSLLKPIVDRVVVVAAKTERARQARDLRQAFIEQRVPVEAETSVREGVRRAVNAARSGQPILVTGSHFVVGEALAFLHGKNYLTINQ